MAFEMFVLHFQSEVVMTIIEIISYTILLVILITTIVINERELRNINKKGK